MFAALLAGFLLAPPKFDFYADEPYDRGIPSPDATLGYPLGTKHTNFRDQERVLMAIANAAGRRVKVIEFGKTWEGRPQRIYIVSSAANMARLDEIKRDNQDRADGKVVTKKDPAFVWINECIHGDETASFEAGMGLLYNLAASGSGRISKMMDDAVVAINPCYNPDGHERYVVYYNSIAVGTSAPGAYEANQPSVVYGRSNHYRFDMNRDRIALSQTETKNEIAEFLKWHPQVYVDQHGQVATYFFPPNAMSQNANADRERVNKWTNIFGRATGAAFDKQGWTYFVRDTFDLYYPGYLDSFTTLSGAIGMTHETDGGRVLAQRRADDTTLTLRDGAMKHFTSALAVIEAAGQRSADLITSYSAFKRDAVSGKAAGKFQRVVLSGDKRALLRLSNQLATAGIHSEFAGRSWSQSDAHDYWTGKMGAVTFPAGALVVDMAQSQCQLAKSLLEPGSDFEPEFLKAQLEKKKTAPEGEIYPGPDGTEFYDTTAWALPYAHNLRAWWCESAPEFAKTAAGVGTGSAGSASSVGYALIYEDDEDALAAAEILRSGVKGMVNNKPMKLGDKTFPRGTFLFLAARNEDRYSDKINSIALKHGSQVVPIPSSFPEEGRQGPGSESVTTLRSPKIAVVFGNGTNMAQAGAMWYLMDNVFRLPFSAISTNALNGDLTGYTCIVIPSGSGATITTKLREWMSAGGCVVALGGLNWATGSSGFVDLQENSGDYQDLPGAIFKAQLDPRSFLSYGYTAPDNGLIDIAVPVEGSGFYKVRKEGGSVVSFVSDDKATKLLSGWSWPNDSEKSLAGTTWLQDAPVGRGHAVLFTFDPTSRAMWPGLYKMLLNAMIIGSGS